MTTPRIPPLAPPYEADTEALLRKMTPPGAPDILALFRVLAHHPELAARMTGWGGFLLGRKAQLSLRERELVIDRVCALCRSEYEWGVHVAAFAGAAGLTPEAVAALSRTGSTPAATTDAGWAERDRLLLAAVDELHERSDIGDALWARLAQQWSTPQLLEVLMLTGWYHAISYVCNAARVPLESWGARWPSGQAAHQRVPSSSTSNFSVALGGITPPAPRAP